jgi:UDP-glucose-4-epimerase GalE
MKRVLVTGGAGYIGSHTSKRLSLFGFEPICCDNLSTGNKKFVNWGPFEFCELKDTNLLVQLIKKYQPVSIIHFAGNIIAEESVINPLKYYYENVGITLSLLKAMEKTNVKSIVFSSSAAVYGIPTKKIINEKSSLKPINPYGQSKLIIERILIDLAKQNKISQISLRYFNAAGADKDTEIGESHEPETHLIPLAIKSALAGSLLKVFGTDFPTPDGTAVRDYVHVEDLADAHIKALDAIQNGVKSECINLGTGKGFSVKEIIDAIKELGFSINFENVKRREGDPPFLVANNEKALKILNWKPKYNNIKDIIKTAIKWHTSNNFK